MAIRSHPGVQKNARQWHFIRAERSSSGSCRSHQWARKRDAPLGNGVLLYLVPGLAFSFPVLLSYIVLPPLASKSLYYRSCRPENSCEGVPTHSFGAFLRDVSQAPLPGLLEPSLTVQMCDVCCGLASYGSYVSDLVIPFSSGLHAFTEFAFIDTWNFAKAPSSHRGAEGRWRCRRLLVAFSGGLQQTLSLWSLCSDSPTSSRPQPLGSVGDDTPCEDTREDVGLCVQLLATTCCRVALMCRCQACNRTAVALVAPGPRRGAL